MFNDIYDDKDDVDDEDTLLFSMHLPLNKR